MAPILSLQDLDEAARRYLPLPLYGYIAGAVETNLSASEYQVRGKGGTTSGSATLDVL